MVRRARLVLRDRVVTGDLLVEDGLITEIGPRLARRAHTEIDAAGRLLLPGAVDLDWRYERPDELGPRTRAALRGGVTTLVAVANAEGPEALRAEHDACGEHSACRVGLWQRAADLEAALSDRARGWFVDGALLHAPEAPAWFARAERVLVVDPVDPARIRSRAALYGERPALSDHARIHDVDSAVAAVRHACDLARTHGTAAHLLHVGSAEEALVLADRPKRVTAAVRVHSLLLDDDEAARLAERAVTEPPLRKARHLEALWEALRADAVGVIAPGDRHVPVARKALGYPQTPVGGPTAEWLLPLVAGAVAAGRLGWPEVARATAEQPARIAGLARKGRLEVGWDADLVLVDDTAHEEITSVHSPSGWSLHAGRRTGGRVDLVLVGGRPALRDDEIVAGVRGGLV